MLAWLRNLLLSPQSTSAITAATPWDLASLLASLISITGTTTNSTGTSRSPQTDFGESACITSERCSIAAHSFLWDVAALAVTTIPAVRLMGGQPWLWLLFRLLWWVVLQMHLSHACYNPHPNSSLNSHMPQQNQRVQPHQDQPCCYVTRTSTSAKPSAGNKTQHTKVIAASALSASAAPQVSDQGLKEASGIFPSSPALTQLLVQLLLPVLSGWVPFAPISKLAVRAAVVLVSAAATYWGSANIWRSLRNSATQHAIGCVLQK